MRFHVSSCHSDLMINLIFSYIITNILYSIITIS
nr:MAG TPA: hypothetical protein [Caudoviricetes sp.]